MYEDLSHGVSPLNIQTDPEKGFGKAKVKGKLVRFADLIMNLFIVQQSRELRAAEAS